MKDFFRIVLFINRAFFREEERSFPTERRMPPGAPRLTAGQRVSFTLNESPEGGFYATDVKPLDEDT
ncbi:MAG: hypothetical protein GAK28_00936 [Luteibacter sp.]|uniref:hypothetical protein n=1 Tax=Luteibacter sp. TaxID=1886636 RepID=UPI00137EDEC7|nr:hypothetical protein [Luteibacter sp.]KAF1008515.1 MAG: hypothetical protein GAK28_00936 [Luteibacter sp.]